METIPTFRFRHDDHVSRRVDDNSGKISELTRPVMLQILQSGRFALKAERILVFNAFK